MYVLPTAKTTQSPPCSFDAVGVFFYKPTLDPAEADVEGKIFLGGLTWQTTEEMLKSHFGKWGELNDVILMRNKITGEPRGFGFVQFQQASCECLFLFLCGAVFVLCVACA